MPDPICTEDDWYVRNIPRWVVVLSDGTTAYGDDDRPGLEEPSAWVRLDRHCRANGLWIAEMRFQFRTNVVATPPGREAYFFARVASFGAGGPFAGVRVGYSENGQVYTAHCRVPEMTVVDYEIRPLDLDSRYIIRGRPS